MMARYLSIDTDIERRHVDEALDRCFNSPFFQPVTLAATGLREGVLHWFVSGYALDPYRDETIRGRRRHGGVEKDTVDAPDAGAYLDTVQRSILRWRHTLGQLSPFEACDEKSSITSVSRRLSPASARSLLSWSSNLR